MIRDLALNTPLEAATGPTKATVFSLVTLMLSWDANYQLLGFVSLNVILGAVIGALLGVGYADPIVPRRRLAMVTIVNSLLAATLGAILPHVPGFGWLGKAAPAAIALVLAFVLRWALPAAIERLPGAARALLDRWIGDRGKPNGSGGGA